MGDILVRGKKIPIFVRVTIEWENEIVPVVKQGNGKDAYARLGNGRIF
jgi:hypothetical protein